MYPQGRIGSLKFKDLKVGERFNFTSESDPEYKFSGMARGPWVKLTARTYTKHDGSMTCTVGSINVQVEPSYGR